MEFTRKKRRGQKQSSCKTWTSEDQYRIVWRKEVAGVSVPPRYQATVRTVIPNYGNTGRPFEMWEFTESRRQFKTLKAAKDSCEAHRKLWDKACQATGERGLKELFGRIPFGFPVWAKAQLPRKVYDRLMK
jgi:hypothetical protein